MQALEGNSELIAIIIDIVILFVIILSAILASRRGFIYSFLKLFQSLICIIIAALSAKPLANLVAETTMIDEKISTGLHDSLTRKIPEGLPPALKESASAGLYNKTDHWAQLILICISFLIMLILITIVINLIISFFDASKRGYVGLLNGTMGFLFGAFRGILTIGLVMLVISIFAILAAPKDNSLITYIRLSTVGRFFYDHNPVLFMVHRIFQ